MITKKTIDALVKNSIDTTCMLSLTQSRDDAYVVGSSFLDHAVMQMVAMCGVEKIKARLAELINEVDQIVVEDVIEPHPVNNNVMVEMRNIKVGLPGYYSNKDQDEQIH